MARHVRIGNVTIGEDQPCYFIAEAGVNHNGDPAIARRLIEAAAAAKANAVKFQKRTVGDILVRAALEKPYASPTALADTYGAHREKLELDEDTYRELYKHALDHGIAFLASGWDKAAVDFLDHLGVPAFKVASADLTNLPLLDHIARKGKPVILSTGMSSIDEVDDAVDTISAHTRDLILLHCVSAYPCDNDKCNIRGIEMLRNRYHLLVGYSGHERGVAVTVAARALGAVVIERHFTLDRAMRGPDHAASLEVQGLQRVIHYIRSVEQAMGTGEKSILPEEVPIRQRLAKSIASTVHISKGSTITGAMLTVRGPGTGLKPKHLSQIVGKVAQADIEEDTLLPQEALRW